MNSDDTEALIYEWMDEQCPSDADWLEIASIDDMAIAPEDVRIVAALDAIEYNLSAGGWPQFLWQCFARWRQVIELARLGYRKMGALPQVAALDSLYRVCKLNEEDCWTHMLAADGSLTRFGKFAGGRNLEGGNDWERLFFDSSGIYQKRLEWLARDRERICRALGKTAEA